MADKDTQHERDGRLTGRCISESRLPGPATAWWSRGSTSASAEDDTAALDSEQSGTRMSVSAPEKQGIPGKRTDDAL